MLAQRSRRSLVRVGGLAGGAALVCALSRCAGVCGRAFRLVKSFCFLHGRRFRSFGGRQLSFVDVLALAFSALGFGEFV